MIGKATIFPVVIMIAYQMAIDVIFKKNFRKGVIKWLQWAPTSV
jgi:hypothetical protein